MIVGHVRMQAVLAVELGAELRGHVRLLAVQRDGAVVGAIGVDVALLHAERAEEQRARGKPERFGEEPQIAAVAGHHVRGDVRRRGPPRQLAERRRAEIAQRGTAGIPSGDGREKAQRLRAERIALRRGVEHVRDLRAELRRVDRHEAVHAAALVVRLVAIARGAVERPRRPVADQHRAHAVREDVGARDGDAEAALGLDQFVDLRADDDHVDREALAVGIGVVEDAGAVQALLDGRPLPRFRRAPDPVNERDRRAAQVDRAADDAGRAVREQHPRAERERPRVQRRVGAGPAGVRAREVVRREEHHESDVTAVADRHGLHVERRGLGRAVEHPQRRCRGRTAGTGRIGSIERDRARLREHGAQDDARRTIRGDADDGAVIGVGQDGRGCRVHVRAGGVQVVEAIEDRQLGRRAFRRAEGVRLHERVVRAVVVGAAAVAAEDVVVAGEEREDAAVETGHRPAGQTVRPRHRPVVLPADANVRRGRIEELAIERAAVAGAVRVIDRVLPRHPFVREERPARAVVVGQRRVASRPDRVPGGEVVHDDVREVA
ncbi:MAG TPA: hypothetical protein VF698_05900, partial [Thermoanaerobaculia bacterium]